MSTVPLFLLACVSLALADYDCVCNYNVEEVVHAAPTDTSETIGYMYEFDCKEHIPVASLVSSWLAVAFEHRQGYVQANSAVQIQKCQGSPPAEDRVTTTTSTTAATTTTSATSTPMLTTSTTTTSTTTQPTTTTTTPTPTTSTPRPTTTTTKPTTSTTQTTTTTPQPTTTTTTTTTTPKPATTTPQPTTTTKTTPKLTTTTPQPTTTTQRTTTSTLRPSTTQSTTTTTKSTTTTTKQTTTTQRPTTTTTTTLKPTTTTQKPTPTTKIPSTTHIPVTHAPITSKPTTHAPSVTGSDSSCYNTQHHYAHNIKGTLTSNGNICYEFVTSTVHWLDAENDCMSKGGHLAHIASAQEQTYIYNVLKTHYNHRVWIGLHDRQTEEQFQWTAGSPVTYTHWAPDRYSLLHALYDCVELDPTDSGFWKDRDCSTAFQKSYGYICEYGGSGGPGLVFPSTNAPNTQAPTTQTHWMHSLDGNTNLCSSKNRQHSQRYGTILAQYGSSCYELMPRQKMTWQHAETLCQNGGGHLAHIQSAAEQTFIQSFMQRHMDNHAVWIGLHDLNVEGQYEWTSGNSVRYLNFIAGHLSNYANRFTENCFVLFPYKGGKWDDIPCGSSFGQLEYGETHPMLCQFPTSTVSLIG